MKTRKRRWLPHFLEAALGLALWFAALRLLGVAEVVPPGIAGSVGSVIVLFGCLSLAGRARRLLEGVDPDARERDLYTEAQAEIAAERRLRQEAEAQAAANTPSSRR